MRRSWFLIIVAWLLAAPSSAQQAPDPLLGQFGSLVEVAPQPPEAARLAQLMSSSLAALEPQRRGRQDVYLLVASLWDDPVFEREATEAEALLRARLGAEHRSIILSAGGRGPRSYPAATPTNISAALGHIGGMIDADEDLVVLFITSHGLPDGAAALRERNRLDATLRPIALSAMLSQANIRNRVVIVSACFSGAFVPPLANAETIVLTAAQNDRTSFGCQPENEWTFFGDALFNHGLRSGQGLLEAFDSATTLIGTWEREQNLSPPSNPQKYVGPRAEEMLRRAERAAR